MCVVTVSLLEKGSISLISQGPGWLVMWCALYDTPGYALWQYPSSQPRTVIYPYLEGDRTSHMHTCVGCKAPGWLLPCLKQTTGFTVLRVEHPLPLHLYGHVKPHRGKVHKKYRCSTWGRGITAAYTHTPSIIITTAMCDCIWQSVYRYAV